MGLDDLLLQLDSTLWKGFEQVTEYAYQKLGYSKYDLAAKSKEEYLDIIIPNCNQSI
ncbi:hypothetical protein HYX14_00640 [Candidatus Woesearchaeota archaeon]|nr:hypothetical protein [Candidatus Woesearchaeota archaeon]